MGIHEPFHISRFDRTKPLYDELYDMTYDPHYKFDLDAYCVYIAGLFPEKISAYRAELISIVVSRYQICTP